MVGVQLHPQQPLQSDRLALGFEFLAGVHQRPLRAGRVAARHREIARTFAVRHVSPIITTRVAILPPA
jgi:hypothetical protein